MIARGCSGLTAACVLSAAAFLAGCSSSTTATSAATGIVNGASASASSKSAACKSAEDLKASITGLKDVNIRAEGTSAVSAQVTKIKQDFDSLKANAKGQFSAQVTDLSTALDKLTASLDAAKASLNAGTLSALASAAGSVVTAGTNLVNAVAHTC
jgi:soluble cytochrome b562